MTTWPSLSREDMARRVAQDIEPGTVVNLGIGMPELVGNYLRLEDEIIIHTENGIIGSGPTVEGDLRDYDLINAGRKCVSLVTGGHFVDHVDSFSIVRGGHLDITILGAFEVSISGDLANWSTGHADDLPSPGGAMDLAVGAGSVFIMMNLLGRDGAPKLVSRCTLPLTAAGVVTRLYTDVAVFDLSKKQPTVINLVPGLSLDSLSETLGLPLNGGPKGIGRFTVT